MAVPCLESLGQKSLGFLVHPILPNPRGLPSFPCAGLGAWSAAPQGRVGEGKCSFVPSLLRSQLWGRGVCEHGSQTENNLSELGSLGGGSRFSL